MAPPYRTSLQNATIITASEHMSILPTARLTSFHAKTSATDRSRAALQPESTFSFFNANQLRPPTTTPPPPPTSPYPLALAKPARRSDGEDFGRRRRRAFEMTPEDVALNGSFGGASGLVRDPLAAPHKYPQVIKRSKLTVFIASHRPGAAAMLKGLSPCGTTTNIPGRRRRNCVGTSRA